MDGKANKESVELETDINDVFENIALCEHQISNEGFEEGLPKGKKEGKIDGFHLGYHKGLEIGREVGFYKGILKVLGDNAQNLKFNEKTVHLINKIGSMLENFPNYNCEEVDILSSISDIRISYRKLLSLLKLKLHFSTSNPPLSF